MAKISGDLLMNKDILKAYWAKWGIQAFKIIIATNTSDNYLNFLQGKMHEYKPSLGGKWEPQEQRDD